jgi:hypothetical protein
MRFQNLTAVVAVLGAAVVVGAPAAHAGVNPVKYDDQPTFDALGTIDQKTNFDAFDPKANTSPGNPYTVGVLTIKSDDNVVDGYQFPGSTASRNLIINDGPPPHGLSGEIGGVGYNLFAFRIGDLLESQGFATITLYSDGGGSYTAGVTNPDVADGLDFHGFEAATGHYFTGFAIHGNGDYSAIGLTDFEIGHTSGGCIVTSVACGGGVPEPMPWALMIMGLGAVGAAIRRRQPAVA